MAKYPNTIPTLDEIFKAIDHVDWTNASEWDDLRAELRAALVELGTLPKGASADVKTRLGTLAPKASPIFTGQATIPTINLTGGQIAFPAAAAPSADSNTLDEYEEGYYTATLICGTSGTITLHTSYDTLAYTKVGRNVFLQGKITISSVSAPLGSLSLGLPFVISDLAELAEQSVGVCAYDVINALGDPAPLMIRPFAGLTLATIRELTTTGQINNVANHIKAGSELNITLAYIKE